MFPLAPWCFFSSHRGGTDCPVAQGPDRLPAVEIPARRASVSARKAGCCARVQWLMVVNGGENGGEKGGLW